MIKNYKIIILLILIIFPFPTSSHVQHYEKTNHIEFDIYRNDINIGKHIFDFNRVNENLTVKSEINFEIKKFGIVIFRYHVVGTEYYEKGQLIKFVSKTNHNGKKKYVNVNLEGDQYLVDGSSYQGKTPKDYLIGTWWNHNIVKANAQISAVSGRIIEQKVTFLGKENVEINGKIYSALHFNFSSTDKKLSEGKKLNTDVWYDEKTLNWIKASFDKKGTWIYKLISVN